MELFAQIRRDARVDGLGIRELARKYQVGRTTVRLALESAVPPEKKPRVRTAPRLEGFKAAIDGMLVEDLTAPKKQRHTAKRVFARLIEEHAAAELSYSTVRDYVRARPLGATHDAVLQARSKWWISWGTSRPSSRRVQRPISKRPGPDRCSGQFAVSAVKRRSTRSRAAPTAVSGWWLRGLRNASFHIGYIGDPEVCDDRMSGPRSHCGGEDSEMVLFSTPTIFAATIDCGCYPSRSGQRHQDPLGGCPPSMQYGGRDGLK